MPAAPYTAPSVNPSVVNSPSLGSATATGGVLGMIGTAPTGSSLPGKVYTSFAQFKRDYGDPAGNGAGYTGPLAAQLYFTQSGGGSGLTQGLVFRRIGTTAAALTLVGTSLSLTLTATAAYAGSAGNGATVVVAAPSGGNQTVTITDGNGVADAGSPYTIVDNSTPATNLMTLINQQSAIFTASAPTDSSNPFTTGTFNPTGGADGKGAAIQQADLDAMGNVLVNGVCTLDGLLATAQLLQTHVETNSASYSKPRVGFAGPALGTSVATIEGNALTLLTSDGRMVYAGHDGLVMFNPVTGKPINLDGFYWAPVAAGLAFSRSVSDPSTWDQVLGVLGPVNPQSEATLTALSQSGCWVVDTGYNGLVCKDAVTTTNYSGTVFGKLVNRTALDEFVRRVQFWAATQLVGQRNGPDVPQRIISGTNSVGQRAVQDLIIASLDSVTPVSSGVNGYNDNVSLHLLGEVDIINIPITILTS